MNYDVYLNDELLNLDLSNMKNKAEPPCVMERSWIYILFDKDSNVVYIGQSFNHPVNRVFVHLKKGVKVFAYYKAVLIDKVYNPDKMNNFEAELIIRYNPMYNKVLPKNKRWVNLSQAKGLLGIDKRKIKKLIRESGIEVDTRMYDSKVYFSFDQIKALV